MTTASTSPQYIAYWLGYAPNGVASSPMPDGTTVAVAFLVGLNAETTLGTNHISSGGYTGLPDGTWSKTLLAALNAG